MTTPLSHDVLIVGAGPAGCAAGITLARAGVDVCVVDRARFPRDKTCGDAVSNDAVALLAQLGALPEVLGGAHAPVRRSAAVFPGDHRLERSYARPGYIVPRLLLDDGLRRALQRSGASLLQEAPVQRLLLQHGRVAGAVGPGLQVHARVVIAADGHGSVAWPLLGGGTHRGAQLALSATSYLRGVTFPHGDDVADHYFEQALPYGYGWIFPAVGGVANVGVYLRGDAYARGEPSLLALLSGFCARHEDRLGAAEPAGKPRVWSLPLAPPPMRLAMAGLLVAGDAGYLVDPLSGEGIWQALWSGVRAGESAALAIAGGALSPALIASYEQACAVAIGRPSRLKRRVQQAVTYIVAHELYRSRLLRRALALGFEHKLLEMTKS